MPGATITAIDLAAPFCARLKDGARRRGLSDRIRVRQAEMATPPLEPGTLDLLWCEGAAYIIGFAEALARWRPFLKSSGYCIVSECEWLNADRPEAAVRFWAEAYPAMATREENVDRARATGYHVVDTHVLAAQDWDDYYAPIAQAIEDGRAAQVGSDFAPRLSEEWTVFNESNGSYGYVFYIMRPKSPDR